MATAPLGLVGVAAACNTGSGSASAEATDSTAGVAAPNVPVASQSGPVLQYVPKHEELTYTFGGAKPVHRIAPGTRIVSWTEDCFDGMVKTPSDLPSKGHGAWPRQSADGAILDRGCGTRRYAGDPHPQARARARTTPYRRSSPDSERS
jgi:hypothetical protein